MRGAHGTADRFRALIGNRLLPGLADLGFDHRLPDSLAVAEAFGVVWLVDLDLAPWSKPEKICFTVSWAVHVPGLDDVVGDPSPEVPSVATSAIRGRLGDGDGDGLDVHWFELRALPGPLATLADNRLAQHVLASIANEVLPKLRNLSTPVEVQQHLHDRLVTGRAAPSDEELQTIRRIAALSLLLGDRDNAARWLDHLEDRLSAVMAPDLVHERIDALRQRALLAS